MEKILVSACFLGDLVRYDGKTKQLVHEAILQWQEEGRLLSICPEVSGGLEVPRAPAEIQQGTRRILTTTNIDVTKQFTHGAKLALSLCKRHKIKYALLKESSPSCGSTTIYNGNFENIKIKGRGVTAALLLENGILVFSEGTINQLVNIIKQSN